MVLTLGAVGCNRTPLTLEQRIDNLFEPFDRPGVPGAVVMVIQGDTVRFKGAYGLADLERGIPCSTHTNFRLASLTKQFTALAIMQLVERGGLAVDSPLAALWPDLPTWGRQVRVRHLLTHTAGLVDYEDLIPDKATVQVHDADVLTMLRTQDSTYFPPGSEYRYSNTGYALLALLVEQASGLSFAQYLERNIFAPLGMSTTVAYEQGISSVERRAFGHSAGETGFTRTDQSLTSAVLGDGGIYSSVEDLFRWDQALYTGRLVGADLLQEAFTAQVEVDSTGQGYGWGWFIDEYRGEPLYRHTGSTIGFKSMIERYSERRFTVIVLMNRGEYDQQALARQIADWALFGDG